MMIRRLRLLLAILVIASPSGAAAEWRSARSGDVLLIGDTPERAIVEIAQQVERIREVLSRVLPAGATVSPVPTVIVVFRTAESLAPFRLLFEGRPVDSPGYFLGGEDSNFIVVNAERSTLALSTILHEYTHVVVGNTLGVVPAWVDEGLAEFYQTFELRDRGRTAVLGLPSDRHLRELRTQFMPLESLVAVDRSSSVYNEGNRRGVFYAESWALVHYLMTEPSRAGQLSTFLARTRAGVPSEEAFREAFDADWQSLERELRNYVGLFSFRTTRVEFDRSLAGDRGLETTVMLESETRGYLGELLSRSTGREADARAYLERTLATDPDAARAASLLGLLELGAGRTQQALQLLEHAVVLAPDDGAIQARLGRGLIQHARETESAREDTLDRARRVLSTSLALQPDSASTLALLGYVEGASEDTLDQARLHLEEAVRLAPVRDNYQLTLVEVCLKQRDHERATELLRSLAARGSEATIRARARAMLAVITATLQ